MVQRPKTAQPSKLTTTLLFEDSGEGIPGPLSGEAGIPGPLSGEGIPGPLSGNEFQDLSPGEGISV